MWRTGCLGAPLEYLNLLNRVRELEKRLGTGVEYWLNLQKVRTSPNSVFSWKVFSADLRRYAEAYPDALSEIWATTVVYLTRQDKLAQAISYARASKSGGWFAGLGQAETIAYDPSLIDTALGWIARSEADWENLFTLTGCSPLRVTYEQIIANPQETIQSIATHAGVDLSLGAGLDIPGIKIQRDAASQEWNVLYQRHRLAPSGMAAG